MLGLRWLRVLVGTLGGIERVKIGFAGGDQHIILGQSRINDLYEVMKNIGA